MKKTVKKIAIALVLTSVCSLTIFAGEGDGTIPTGGRTCPNGQTTCLVNAPQEPETKPVYIEIFDYLKSLFG
ncbi:MAG: hypothetical protein LUM44_04605 [Pyrinomonadaceae bacterium]|nr:hypothetical protein [Pyrinomonadaceae bacterium]